MKKTFICALICISFVPALSSCALINRLVGKGGDTPTPVAAEITPEEGAYKYNIAVILPDGREQKWSRLAESVAQRSENMGYGSEIFFADSDSAKQAVLIDDAVEKRVNCIIIAPVDSYSQGIRNALEGAKRAKISVIAYDRLVMDTESVDCFVAVDPYACGRLCALRIIDTLGLKGGGRNIELFMPDSSNASSTFFYHGAMDVLLPLIEKGRINVRSGQTSFTRTASGEGLSTGERLAEIMDVYYNAGERLDAVLTPGDNAALEAIEVLESRGYGADGNFPVITGAGCHIENIHMIEEGKQQVSLFEDERIIAAKIVETADFLTHNIFPADADTTTYNNGSKIVPAVLLEPVELDAVNYKELLIGGEYYNYRDLIR